MVLGEVAATMVQATLSPPVASWVNTTEVVDTATIVATRCPISPQVDQAPIAFQHALGCCLGTVDRLDTLGSHHHTDPGPRMTTFAREPLDLLPLNSINYQSPISPPPLLLQAALILSSVHIALAACLCGALGLMV